MQHSSSTKQQVLRSLIATAESGQPVSGAALAETAGVSRNAVWKAINALKAEGYRIESEQSRGYILRGPADLLSEEAIRAKAEHPLNVILLDRVDSTNDYAKIHLQGDEPMLVVADEQTAGRGRYGRSFFSPRGTGIYMSFVFTPRFPLGELSFVTAITATIVRDVLAEKTGLPFTIKWVNDTFLNGRKVSGILTEAVGSLESGNFEHIIIGIGINVYRQSLPQELRDIAGCVTENDLPAFTRSDLIAALSARLHDAFCEKDSLHAERFLETYRRHCFLIGREILVHRGSERFRARVKGIDDRFALLVAPCDRPDTVLALSDGEVSLTLDRS